MLLSIIIPCYNEEAVLRTTHERLTIVMKGMNLDYELIFVNDGSRDRTQEILAELQLFDSRMRVLLLSRNFGHQVAVTAGLEEATGEAVVIIDGDLQDPPEVIPQMIQLWRDGNEVVYGLRDEREGESRFKLWTAKLFYRLINRLSETKMPSPRGLRQREEPNSPTKAQIQWVNAKPTSNPKQHSGAKRQPNTFASRG